MSRNDFVHLHTHSEYSWLDGMGTIDEYVKRARELQQPALAITDHGNICGAPEFYSTARKAGIEPLIGEEFYYVPDSTWRPEKGSKERISLYHATIVARGYSGYKVLAELSTESHRRFYQKPLIDRTLIESLGAKDRSRLTVFSGCAGSFVSNAISNGDMYVATDEMLWWREMFPHYYIELMHHDTEFDEKLNKGLIQLARRYKVPMVITNDPHYVTPDQETPHDCLLAIQTGSDIDAEDRFSFDGTGYHLRSRNEMYKAFKRYGSKVWKEGSANTLKIAKECRTRVPDWEKRNWHIPRYKGADDPAKELRRLTKKGLKSRGLLDNKTYVRQAKHELEVIHEAKLEDFLLITREIIDWARSEGIPVGPGRGSVCGTLVGFSIGLHKIDPIRYDLKFERFLNPARPKMPDIDTDFGKARRNEVFAHIVEEYGTENVVHVAAFQTMKLKRAFHAIAKAYGMSHPERMRYSKLLNEDEEDTEDVLPDEIRQAYPEMANLLDSFQGLKAGVSQHPAGVIIADPKDDIRKLVPEMYIASSKKFVAQYDLSASEDMGLLKEDILSLRSLDTIAECVRIVKENTGEEIDPDSWVPDEEPRDDEIWDMIAQGHTGGVFQMEGPTNQRGAKDVKPKCFEDVVSVTSLYRTGPIKAGFPQMFLDNRRKGKKKIEYLHPLLKNILETTWGVILYQEQVMAIGEILAGFDMELVDDIKEAIKKKKSSMMDDLKPKFIEGCAETNDIPESISGAIWKQIEGYSGYSYNRSHAVAYTMITYQNARLKLLYPLAYTAALLRTVTGNDKAVTEKRQWYLTEALENGVKVRPPCINLSDSLAVADYDNQAIRFGLQDVKGVGDAACKKILTARPQGGFEDVSEVAEAVNNVGTLRVLEQASCLRALGRKGDPAATEELLDWTFRDTMKKYRAKYKRLVVLPEDGVEDVTVIGQITRITKDTTKHGKPYVNWRVRWSLTKTYHIRLWNETKPHWNIPEGSIVMIHGEWSERWGNVSVGDPSMIRLIRRAKVKQNA